MVDVDTFLTTLYVMVDDFCQSRPPKRRPGPDASLSQRGRHPRHLRPMGRFGSERDFYRYATSQPAQCLPHPARALSVQPPRALHTELIEEIGLHLAEMDGGARSAPTKPWTARRCLSGTPSVGAQDGWPACADIGWSNSLGWYEGFRLLVAVDPTGVITGFGFCCCLHRRPAGWPRPSSPCGHDRTPGSASVGSASSGPYVADKGFEGEENHRRWLECYGVRIIHPPKRNSLKPDWPKRLRTMGGRHPPDRGDVSTTSSSTPSVCGGSDLTSWRACELVWRRGWLCTISASGSTISSVVPVLAFADLLGW